MTDQYVNQALKTAVASLCQSLGWNSAQSSTIDILADLWKRQFVQIARRTHNYAEHFGRSDPNFDDASLALGDMNISVGELEEYVSNFDPVRLPYRTPKFPVPKESHLNFLKPGSAEVLSRPVHIHEYMPAWEVPPDESSPDKDEELEQVVEDVKIKPMVPNGIGNLSIECNGHLSPTNNSLIESSAIASSNNKINNNNNPIEVKIEVEEASQTNAKLSNSQLQVQQVQDNLIEEPLQSPSLPSSSSNFPYSPFSSSKTKRNESGEENPVLKRVRLMMEEEGHPFREIASVMMTTSGFLSSSREGRLPETKPPANRNFFEPEPIIEPKKKLPNMKKIIGNIKKIDKEKENHQTSSSTSNHVQPQPPPPLFTPEIQLFDKPDKIKISSSKTPKIKLKPSKLNSKDKTLKDPLRKLKEKHKLNYESKKKKLEDPITKYDKKLKIFKKAPTSSSLKLLANNKEHHQHRADSNRLMKIEPIRQDSSGAGLDEIVSDEDFNDTSKSSSLQNKHKQKHHTNHIPKEKKSKTGVIILPISKVSPIISPNLTTNSISASIIPSTSPTIKKKRGRPKKDIFLQTPELFSDIKNFTPIIKVAKSLKPSKLEHNREKSPRKLIVPEISLNIKKSLPPPPDLTRIKLPNQPGLIPTSSLPPPPPLKYGGTGSNHLPPSISITPATPGIQHNRESKNRESSSGSSSSLGLPSTVCSSVTITRIDIGGSRQGSPGPMISTNRQHSPSPTVTLNIPSSDSSSGISITPIFIQTEKPDKPQPPQSATISLIPSGGSGGGLAKLEEDMKSKDQRRKEKEKRKELKKEKKKERKEKEKHKEKDREREPRDRDRERNLQQQQATRLLEIHPAQPPPPTIIRKEKKDKDKDGKRDKSEKKRKRILECYDDEPSPPPPPEPTVPKLTLKIHSSNATTPVDSPIHVDRTDTPPPHHKTTKITIKPMEDLMRRRSPSPELARFSPLITRPQKISTPKPSQPIMIPSLERLTPCANIGTPVIGTSDKKGPGRPRGRGRPPKTPSMQSGLITETVGFYIDEQGNKVWICPTCGRQDDGSPMIGCDTCDDWYHFLCVGILNEPDESASWYCPRCLKKQESMNQQYKKKIAKHVR